MQHWLLSCLFILFTLQSFPQRLIDLGKNENSMSNPINHYYTVSGTPFVNSKFSRVVEGTPFFNKEAMLGAIVLSEGREYRNIKIRLNLLETQVNFFDSTDTELIASTPIREVILWDTLQNIDFRFVNSDYIKSKQKPERDFYELLSTGNSELYKQHKKIISENRPYGSAAYEQTIYTDVLFFILKDGAWKKIKKLSELKDIFADKSSEINQYCIENKITKDNEESYKLLTNYYNSLFLQ